MPKQVVHRPSRRTAGAVRKSIKEFDPLPYYGLWFLMSLAILALVVLRLR